MFRAILLGAALALAACADTTPATDRGGSVAAYALRIARQDGPKAFGPGAYCSSACGMWLGYPGTCVHPTATFGFHGVARDPSGLAQRMYEAHLPAGLRAWFRAHAADSDETVRLSGARLIAEGWARECE